MFFPKDFIWGTASAAYQIEGAAAEDGKGPSIWDVFSHMPGKVYNNQNGDLAADAYHRFEEDLDLMQSLGIRHYRFSISWPRVLPDADPGRVNEKGLAYYDRVVDGCIRRGITPWITLYHWDLPLALFEKGGWRSRAAAEAFGSFAALIASHFKGRVSRYFTINEPQCIIGMGHGTCLHAPGTRLSAEDMFLSWHYLLLAHGLASIEIRKADPQAIVGLSSTGALAYMQDYKPNESRLEALAKASFLSLPMEENPGWYFNHQWFLDPVICGHYPEDPESVWANMPQTCLTEEELAADLRLINQKPDLIGLNLYNGIEIAEEESGGNKTFSYVEKYPGYPRTALKWPVTPQVMSWGPRLIYERYHIPIVISENGLSCNDRIYLDGKVHDPDRIDFLARYLSCLSEAVESGVPVKGYFHWSFTDNMEWHSGYEDRFGLIYVDYRDQRRIPKDSAFWYSNLIREQ